MHNARYGYTSPPFWKMLSVLHLTNRNLLTEPITFYFQPINTHDQLLPYKVSIQLVYFLQKVTAPVK